MLSNTPHSFNSTLPLTAHKENKSSHHTRMTITHLQDKGHLKDNTWRSIKETIVPTAERKVKMESEDRVRYVTTQWGSHVTHCLLVIRPLRELDGRPWRTLCLISCDWNCQRDWELSKVSPFVNLYDIVIVKVWVNPHLKLPLCNVRCGGDRKLENIIERSKYFKGYRAQPRKITRIITRFESWLNTFKRLVAYAESLDWRFWPWVLDFFKPSLNLVCFCQWQRGLRFSYIDL